MEVYTEIAICMVLLAGIVYYIKKHPRRLTTPDIIKKYGYTCETHCITTDDDYILTYFRIPNSTSKGSVLLVHGLFGSSAMFVQCGPERGLGFILADAGYDVWLSNVRGTQFSRKHTTYHPFWDSQKFHNFSFHEVGYYDIPNSIDYILKQTGDKSLHYVGLSMGTTAFLIFCSTRPEYQAKIKLASLMSLVAKLEHYSRRGLHKNLAKYIYPIEKIHNFLHLFELSGTGFMREVLPTICNIPGVLPICQRIFKLVSGKRIYVSVNKQLISTVTANSPSNTSLKMLYHSGQLIKNGGFCNYDYGTTQNLQVYGQKTPPGYNLSVIQTPLAIYYGEKDTIAPLKDILDIIPELKTLVFNYLIPSPNFYHSSFLYSANVKSILLDKVLEVMDQY